ncbi:hypothetical protein TNCT_508981 [Trichonephila clavata]|uniref:Uncharacterized protein n=1 Tax=Trichonephila clavata TaxID=2740835 RepID=A0A8X6M4B1_TRICU|nr:hypothetical protein TNCT_508981 [Trichonephila clavata]
MYLTNSVKESRQSCFRSLLHTKGGEVQEDISRKQWNVDQISLRVQRNNNNKENIPELRAPEREMMEGAREGVPSETMKRFGIFFLSCTFLE